MEGERKAGGWRHRKRLWRVRGGGALVSLPTESHSVVSRCRLLTKMAPNASACEIPG